MEYRKLGTSDLEVSVLAFGGWQIGDPGYWGDAGHGAGDAAVHAALDAGINLFDTAEGYGGGEAERALGKALGNRRGDVLIASKVSPEHCAPGQLRAACEGSLQRLGTDCIDLYQVHWPFHDVPMAEAAGEMARLQEEGKVRYAGVSNFGCADLDQWLASGSAVSNQLGYNMLFRAVEYDIAPRCRREGLGILAYMPLMQGLLAKEWRSVDDIPLRRRRTRHFAASREGTTHGEPGHEEELFETLVDLNNLARASGRTLPELALAWLLVQPGVTSVLVGARQSEQVQRNVLAVEEPLGPGLVAQLNEVTGPLKRAMGDNADLWRSGAECRIH